MCTPTTTQADLFDLTLESEGITNTRSYSDIEDMADQLTNEGLQELIPAYTSTSAAVVMLGVRGLPAIAEYTENSSTLNFRVPSLDIDLNFAGATRDESQDRFLDFLKGEGESILTRLLQGFVSETAVDPVAGNPNSLISQMASSDYTISTEEIEIEGAEPLSKEKSRNLLGLSVMAGNAEATGFRTKMISLPINYIVPLNNPQYLLIFDMPIRYLDVDDSAVYDGSLGIGLRTPLMREQRFTWSVTPMVRAGLIGSRSAGALQAVYSGSATSKLKFFFGDLKITVNNMFSLYRTGTVGGEYEGEYDLRNTLFRNGVALSGDLAYQLFDEHTTWELQFVDTQVKGDAWFIDSYDELAFTFGTKRREDRMSWQSLRIGAKYTFADDYDAFQLVLGYRF